MEYKLQHKKHISYWIIITGLYVLLSLIVPGNVQAQERDITFTSDTEEVTLVCGDTGRFILSQELADSYNGSDTGSDIWDDMDWDSGTWEDTGWFYGFFDDYDSGNWDFGTDDDMGNSGDNVPETSPAPGNSGEQNKIAYTEYSSSDATALEVTKDGQYSAKLGKDVILYITAYNSENTVVYNGSFEIVVKADLSMAALSETSHTAYWYDNTKSPLSFIVKVNGAKGLAPSGGNTGFDYEIRSAIEAECSISGEEITISVYSPGSGVIEIVLGDRTFSFKINVKRVTISGNNSLYLVKGKKKQLKLKGTSLKTVWTSSNPSVVKITKNGKMKGKKPGNAIITAKTGSGRTGCVVSVVTAGRLKVLKRAAWIGKHWKYDQQKRMQDGYYDCSALVWKAYLKEKRYIMSKNYAPTSADLGKWCAQHGKIIKGNNTKNLQKLKMKPGAVMFETGSDNGRFKGIYHVEMFTGYTFYGYDYNGKEIIGTKWANRPDNYYGAGDLWAQL